MVNFISIVTLYITKGCLIAMLLIKKKQDLLFED
jgi:hypothetical protein